MRYDEYKDSGATWIGKIPSAWKVGRLKNHLKRTDARNPGGVQVLSLYRELGIVPKDSRDDNHNVTSEDTSNYKYVEVGDFVVNKMKAWQGSVAVSDYEGIVSPAYYVYKFLNNSFYKRYFHYLIRSCYKDEFMRLSAGIRIGQWDLSSNDLDCTLVLVPSMAEQIAIAEFLDKKTSYIDSIIAEAKASIEEYKAWKASIIYEAVTKGLDPNAEMKNSGVEWISRIPANWSVKRTKSLFSYGKGLPITKENLVEEGIPVISYGQIHSKKNPGTGVIEELIRFVPESYINSNPESLVKKGDILVADTSEDLAGCGNAVYVDSDMTLFAGYHTIILKSIDVSDNKYIAYLMKTDAWRSQIRANVSGVKLFSISKRILNSTSVILPSTEEEQKEITNYLDTKCTAIDEIVAEKELLIFDLEKYKKSLIFDVVTGKRKV